MSAEDATQPLASDIRAGVVWYVGCCQVTGEPCMVRQDRNYYDPKCWDVVPVVPKSALDAATARAEQAEAACVSKEDELRRLREFAANILRWSKAIVNEDASIGMRIQALRVIYEMATEIEAAQPPRAERSEL